MIKNRGTGRTTRLQGLHDRKSILRDYRGRCANPYDVAIQKTRARVSGASLFQQDLYSRARTAAVVQICLLIEPWKRKERKRSFILLSLWMFKMMRSRFSCFFPWVKRCCCVPALNITKLLLILFLLSELMPFAALALVVVRCFIFHTARKGRSPR